MELKYTFNTLEEAKQAIEQWFKDCGYDGPDTDGKQKAKIFEEIAELEAEIKSGNIVKQKDELGDVFITITGKCLKDNIYTHDYFETKLCKPGLKIKSWIDTLRLVLHSDCYDHIYSLLITVSLTLNIDLLECATIAYNKIQCRLERGELKVINGTITKGN